MLGISRIFAKTLGDSERFSSKITQLAGIQTNVFGFQVKGCFHNASAVLYAIWMSTFKIHNMELVSAQG